MVTVGAMSDLSTSIATSILLAGVVDDLRSRKFHNWLFLLCSFIALFAVAYERGWSGIWGGGLGFATGVGTLLPLVLIGAIGAGDMKLLGAFGIIAGWQTALTVSLYALVWGAVFGLTRAIVTRHTPALAQNISHLVLFRQSAGLRFQKFPYTIAIFLGWLSYLTAGGF